MCTIPLLLANSVSFAGATHRVDVFKMTSKQSLEKNGLFFVHVQDVEYLFTNVRASITAEYVQGNVNMTLVFFTAQTS
jgi:hypothetical protein